MLLLFFAMWVVWGCWMLWSKYQRWAWFRSWDKNSEELDRRLQEQAREDFRHLRDFR